ncbi:MAG: tetratricopeptide repeat protein [bacterium]
MAKRKAKKAASGAPAATHGSAAPGARRPSPGLIAVIAIAVAYVVIAFSIRFTQDDAYISLRYARHLVEGQGLVFNPGERVEGYTNFAWTLLLALAMKLGAPPVPAGQWLGMLFGAGCVLVAARFARALEGRWGAASVGAAAFTGLNLAFALWSTGGLETALFAFLVISGLERGLAPAVGAGGRRAAPLILALAALTRPEGAYVFALFFAVRALDTWRGGPCAHERGRAGLLRDAALFGGPLVPYAAWKLWYFGDLLPNPFYAKTGTTAAYLRRGVTYAIDFIRSYAIYGAAPVVAGFSAAWGGRRSVEARLLAVWLGWAAYVVLVGGDVLYLHRFWLHFLPVGAVLLARGASWIGERLLVPSTASRPRPAATAGATLLVVAVLVGAGVVVNRKATLERRTQETGFVENMRQSGEWLKENFAPGSTIAITTIGAISYYSDLRVIDMLGLTDHEVAHHPKMIPGITDTWREIQYNAESVLRRRPDAILFSTGIRPSSAAEKALFFYAWFHRSYYQYYYRAKPYRQSIQSCFRLRPDAAPFDPAFVESKGVEWIDAYSEAHLMKGKVRDDRRAAEMFHHCMEISPREFRWPREWWAVTLYDVGDTTASVPLLREIVGEDPYAEVACGRLADHDMRTRNVEEARRLFEAMRQVDPDDNLPWAGLAEIYRVSGDWDEAYRYAKEAVRLWDTNPLHLFLLGSLAAYHGEYDLATWSFQRALQTGPDRQTADDARAGLRIVDALRAGKIRPEELKPPPPTGAGAGPPKAAALR